jgi:hypothetical protein
MDICSLSQVQSDWGVVLTTQRHLASRLKGKAEMYLLRLLWAIMACSRMKCTLFLPYTY